MPQASKGGFWRPVLLTLCAFATVLCFAEVASWVGLGSKPWFGYWDAGFTFSGTPYVIQVATVDPIGATERAGMRPGDRIDIRKLALDDRIAFFLQPFGPRTYTIPVERDGKAMSVRFTASTTFAGNLLAKTILLFGALFAPIVTLVCAWLIALRGSSRPEGQLLGLALLCYIFGNVAIVIVPNGWVWAAESVFSNCFYALQAAALLVLAARYGQAKRIRNVAIGVALALQAILLLLDFLGVAGVLWPSILDPVLVYYGLTTYWLPVVVSAFFIVPFAIAAASAPRSEKARTAWLLLPLPLGILIVNLPSLVSATTTVYVFNLGSYVVSNIVNLLTYAAVTYAVLQRRVLDTQFVISRALVFGTISTIVVTLFVLLEWLLGHVLEDVSRTAGLAANVVLALALGLSMRFIHRVVDNFVDVLFFRKRYEDERALREFAKDAAFVTTQDALFDHAIAKLREHTDARNAALLVDGDGQYVAARWFGESEPPATSENDEAILALKSRHAPIDPNRFDSSIAGDLVLPMLVRGHLVGAVVCGPRSRGEAYAPDEVEALSEFAHGVGSAYDSIERSESQYRRDDAIAEELRALRAAIENRDAR